MYAAIDLVSDKLERQLRKYKTKLLSKNKKNLFIDNLEEMLTEPNEEEIVKHKKIFLKPMDKYEAITQMELLSHSFFIFKNIDDNNICVIYKRKDGDYGLIETK